MDPSVLKVAARYAAALGAAKAALLEKAVQRIPGVRGALISDYSQPRAGTFDVAMDVVLKVTASTESGPVKFQGSLNGLAGAITRTLKAAGGTKISVTPPSLVRAHGTYDGDMMIVSFEISDAPL